MVQRFHPQIGGAEIYAREIALEQARRGHAVTVLTTERAGSPPRETLALDGASIDVVRVPTRHVKGDYLWPPWLPMKGADAWLARADADLLHAHSYRFDTLEAAARASRERSIPMVASALGFYPPENALVALSRLRYDRGRGKRALQQAARCVALTRDEIAHHVALGVPEDRVDVVPPGLKPDALAPGDGAGFRKAHGLEGPVVTFLARLAHDKGLTDLVAAMRDVPDATLAVCGPDAGARAAAEKLVAKLGLERRVRFLGPVPDPRDAYAASDVFVHPSHYEAFGMVIVEAQAQGKPVVTTTAGGCPEAAGEPGVLVPPSDPRAIARAVNALLADPARREALGAAGRERAKGFLWSRVVDQLEGCYQRARAA